MELSKFYVSCVGNLCLTDPQKGKPPKLYKVKGMRETMCGKPIFTLTEIKYNLYD
jgi:hypothetical protein